MKVICVNDTNRPNEIPLSKWVKKDVEYTVIEAKKCLGSNGDLGYKLAEISLEGCEPYKYFSADRFRIPELDDVLQIKQEQLIDL